MAKKTDTDQEIRNKIEEAAQAGMSKKMDAIVEKLAPKLREKQRMFFQVLAMKIIGAKGAPDLGQFTPSWQPLTEAYKTYRLKKKNIAGGRFYEYRSRRPEAGKTSLKELLNSARAETAFGRPLVTRSKMTARGRRVNSVAVLPFPKVREDLANSQIDEKEYLRASNRPIAWRLRNYKGNRLRPILREFMLWWMNVELSALIEKELKNK